MGYCCNGAPFFDAFVLFVVCAVGGASSCTRPWYGNDCTERCGARLQSFSGIIRSPGYETDNGLYSSNEDCDWYIVPSQPNSTVIITFTLMDLEPTFDFLRVYGKPPSYSKLIATYHGRSLPYQLMHRAPIWLNFTTDDSQQYHGFTLEYRILEGAPPTFLSASNSLVTEKGNDVALSCHVTGVPQPVVTWYRDGVDVYSILRSEFIVNSSTIVIHSISEYDTGLFKCKAENYLNIIEHIMLVTVRVPPVVVRHPVTLRFERVYDSSGTFSGPSAVFHCEVNGIPYPTVVWKKNGTLLSQPHTEFDGRSLVIPEVAFSDQGNYSCYANNSVGSIESNSASLIIERRQQCCSPIAFDYTTASVKSGNAAQMSARLDYNHFSVHNISVSLNGLPYTRPVSLDLSGLGYTLLTFGPVTDQSDSGVYGWHALLEEFSSTSLSLLVVSSYTVIMVKELPNVTLSTPSSVVSVFDEILVLGCAVQFTYPTPTVGWYRNGEVIFTETQHKAIYLYMKGWWKTTSVIHFTCGAYNEKGVMRNVTVSVIQRVEDSGWSWWTTSSHCSVTCGFEAGIQIVRRRCITSAPCPGLNFREQTCYPSLRYCHKGNEFVTTVQPAAADITQVFNISRPTSTTNMEDLSGTSQLSNGAVAAITAILTAIFTALLTSAVFRCVFSLKRRKQRISSPTTTPAAETHHNATSDACNPVPYETMAQFRSANSELKSTVKDGYLTPVSSKDVNDYEPVDTRIPPAQTTPRTKAVYESVELDGEYLPMKQRWDFLTVPAAQRYDTYLPEQSISDTRVNGTVYST